MDHNHPPGRTDLTSRRAAARAQAARLAAGDAMTGARRSAVAAAAVADHEAAERRAIAEREAAERAALPRPATAVQDWRNRAACRDTDPELHFPLGVGTEAARQAEEAQEVCRGCTVAAACLAWAVNTGTEYGIWGGLTETDRRALRPARPTPDRPDALDAPLAGTVTSAEAGEMCGYTSGKSFTERVRAPGSTLPRLEPVGRQGHTYVWDRVAVERFAAALRDERDALAADRTAGQLSRAGDRRPERVAS